jgi:RND superfamily putative drug exporter
LIDQLKGSHEMASYLYRLGAFGVRARYKVVGAWFLIVAAVVAVGILFPGTLAASDAIPGSPAQAALTTMDQHFASPDVQSARIVLQAPAGQKVTDPGLSTAISESLATIADVAGVTSVSDPAENDTISDDGRIEVVDVDFSTAKDVDVPAATLAAVKAGGDSLQSVGVKPLYGGVAFAAGGSPVGPTEGIGLLVALAVLVITFGSMLSAGLPLLTAVIGVITSLAGMMGLASVFGISDSAPTLAVMLGLAVGIDYALFIVSRHRTNLSGGMPVGESIARATATAGSAVVFAGATVIIALAGLSVAGVPILTSMGLASAGAVTVAVVLSLTLLPALLAIAGTRLAPKPGSRSAQRALQTSTSTMGVRWITWVIAHPVRTLVAGTVGLIVIAAPAMQLKLALPDEGSDPKSSQSRQVYDQVSHAFGPGANGPLVVLVTDKDPVQVKDTAAQVEKVLADQAGTKDVSDVEVSDDGGAARIQIIPTHGPTSQETSKLVKTLNAAVSPIARSTGSYVAVTGLTAVSIDVSTKLSGAILPFSIVVVGLSLLLLMLAFRSIAIPIKATVGFLLSVGAAFGATVAVFQWGWLAGLIGVPTLGPVASFVPILMMAVLFGLAMDYEVFLVASIQEDYAEHHNARHAIIAGARHSARVVAAAALIMIAVFISFLLSKDPDIMPIAFALAFGILVDAFLVRMTLVPAVLALLGDRAWWLPSWLDRYLPNLSIEGGTFDTFPQEDDADTRESDERDDIPVPA